MNLVASRSRLVAWEAIGGRLSDVTSEAVYEALDRKYLSNAREALTVLCALWQYEIPAHNQFVEAKLPGQQLVDDVRHPFLPKQRQRCPHRAIDIGSSKGQLMIQRHD